MNADGGERCDTNGNASGGGEMQRSSLYNATRPKGPVDGYYNLAVPGPAKPACYRSSPVEVVFGGLNHVNATRSHQAYGKARHTMPPRIDGETAD
jgi:hypothetical protein